MELVELADEDDDHNNNNYRTTTTSQQQKQRHKNKPFVSTIHCVGETFLNNSWWYKSCHFTNLCYHFIDKEFHLFDDDDEATKTTTTPTANWRSTTNFYSSTLFGEWHNFQVSPGGILAEEPRRINLPWFPRVIRLPRSGSNSSNSRLRRTAVPRRRRQTYWHVPSHPILVPFFPRLANNAGHLIWDNWLPLYQLLRMFLLLPEEDNNNRHDPLEGIGGLDSTTTTSASTTPATPHVLFHNLRKKGRCRFLDTWCQVHMIHKFIGMLDVLPEHYLDLTKVNITMSGERNRGSSRSSKESDSGGETSVATWSPYICFDHAVAGLGVLTDHGTNQRHGQYQEDYFHPHNSARGPILYDFRNWVLRNLHIADRIIPHKGDDEERVIRITVSVNSSKDPLRFWNAPSYVEAMESMQLASSASIQVQSLIISQLSAPDQIQLAVQSTMFLSVVGGGSVTAMWLPPGASLILFYPVLTEKQRNDIVQAMLKHRKGHRQSDQYLTNVARLTLDWDVWNHLSYLRVHWLPLAASKEEIIVAADGNTTSVMIADPQEEEQSIQLLLHLIRHEAAFL